MDEYNNNNGDNSPYDYGNQNKPQGPDYSQRDYSTPDYSQRDYSTPDYSQQPPYQQNYSQPQQPPYQQSQPFVQPYNQGNYIPVQPTNFTNPGETSGFSIASLILGICSILTICIFCISIVLGILAIVFFAVAYSKGERNGIATTGLTLGIIGSVISIIIALI